MNNSYKQGKSFCASKLATFPTPSIHPLQPPNSSITPPLRVPVRTPELLADFISEAGVAGGEQRVPDRRRPLVRDGGDHPRQVVRLRLTSLYGGGRGGIVL